MLLLLVQEASVSEVMLSGDIIRDSIFNWLGGLDGDSFVSCGWS